MRPATFYSVNGPRGVYYAVRDGDSGKVWTERTELAAREQAREEGLALIAEETIDHAQLLDLMIPQNMPVRPNLLKSGSDEPTRITSRVETGLTRFLRRIRGNATASPTAAPNEQTHS